MVMNFVYIPYIYMKNLSQELKIYKFQKSLSKLETMTLSYTLRPSFPSISGVGIAAMKRNEEKKKKI